MTRTEVAEMIEFAMVCYPHVQIKEMKKTLDVWTDLFQAVDATVGMKAMKDACKTCKFFPSASEVMTLSTQKSKWSDVR